LHFEPLSPADNLQADKFAEGYPRVTAGCKAKEQKPEGVRLKLSAINAGDASEWRISIRLAEHLSRGRPPTRSERGPDRLAEAGGRNPKFNPKEWQRRAPVLTRGSECAPVKFGKLGKSPDAFCRMPRSARAHARM